MRACWLHISDFHIRGGDSYDRDVVLRALVASVKDLKGRQGRKPDLIFATGDIAQSGKEGEYKLATPFFDALLAATGLERRNLFVIPGNHDVDCDQGVGLARTLASREESDRYFQPGTPKPHLSQKLAAFRKWHDEYFDGIRACPDGSTCGPVEVVQAGDGRIAVLPMNSALFCVNDDADHAKLLVGRRCLDAAIETLRALDADLKVALLHHPTDWLGDIERSNVKADLQGAVDVVLGGHLHETDTGSVATPQGAALHFRAGAAYRTRMWPNAAMYATVDGPSVTVFPIRYEDSPTEVWTVDPSVFPHEPRYEKTFLIPRLSAETATPRLVVQVTTPDTPITPRFRSNIASLGDLAFIGRDPLLQQIGEMLADTAKERVLVLHGPPGVGKSELAREYARRHRDRYPGGTFFIDLQNRDVDLARIGAEYLGLAFPPDLSIKDQCLRAFLSLGSEPVLLIYDNPAGMGDVQDFLPPAGMPCHVVVTSVSERWDPGWTYLAVKPLTRDESLELIRSVGGEAVAASHGKQLAALADGLPMQLVPASRTLAYEARRGRLDSAALKLTPEARSSFDLVYAGLELPVRLLLHAASFLETQRILRDELRLHVQAASAEGTGETVFDRTLDTCFDVHLLEGEDTLRMHQLFASFLRGVEPSGDLAAQVNAARAAQRSRFTAVAKQLADNPADRDLAAAFLTYPLGTSAWDDGGSEISATDGESIGTALHEIGRFDEARPWYERAVDHHEQGNVHGRVDHASLGSSLHQVGVCLSSMGKYDEARPWYERAVEQKEQGDVHGRVDHASLGISLNQVGMCLSSVGKYDEARPWYERAVEQKEQGDVHGRVDHASLGISLHQVGVCLSSVGKYDEARPWYERAVEQKEQGDVHGRVDHGGLGRSLHLVGYCLSSVGKYDEARPWYERAAVHHEQGDVHGRVDHAGLGRSLHEVGLCLSSVDKHDEARPWFERAVEQAEQGDVHGRVDHENLGMSLRALALCLRNLGLEEESLQVEARAPSP